MHLPAELLTEKARQHGYDSLHHVHARGPSRSHPVQLALLLYEVGDVRYVHRYLVCVCKGHRLGE